MPRQNILCVGPRTQWVDYTRDYTRGVYVFIHIVGGKKMTVGKKVMNNMLQFFFFTVYFQQAQSTLLKCQETIIKKQETTLTVSFVHPLSNILH